MRHRATTEGLQRFQTLAELRNLQAYREKEVGPAAQILALGLSSRKNMCIHPTVAEEGSRESVDAKCRKLTASWVSAKLTLVKHMLIHFVPKVINFIM